MAATLSYDKSVSGVQVILHKWKLVEGKRVSIIEGTKYYFRPSKGLFEDKLYPVDVKPAEFYQDDEGKPLDFVGYYGNASATIAGYKLSKNKSIIAGYIKGFGYVQYATEMKMDKSLLNIGYKTGIITGTYSGSDYLNNALSSLDNQTLTSDGSSPFTGGNGIGIWNLAFSAVLNVSSAQTPVGKTAESVTYTQQMVFRMLKNMKHTSSGKKGGS
jgi:hypothetical protein